MWGFHYLKQNQYTDTRKTAKNEFRKCVYSDWCTLSHFL